MGPRDGGEDASLLIRDPWLERSGLSEDHFRSLRLPGGERVRDDHGHEDEPLDLILERLRIDLEEYVTLGYIRQRFNRNFCDLA